MRIDKQVDRPVSVQLLKFNIKKQIFPINAIYVNC